MTPRVKRVPSSPDRSRLVPLALDYDTRLSYPKPNREPVRRLFDKGVYAEALLFSIDKRVFDKSNMQTVLRF